MLLTIFTKSNLVKNATGLGEKFLHFTVLNFRKNCAPQHLFNGRAVKNQGDTRFDCK